MSTSATIPNPNTSATLPVKSETVNFAVVGTVVEGKLTKVRHTSSVAEIDKLKGIGKDGKPEPYTGTEEIIYEQAVTKPSVGTLDGFEQLIPDPEVRLDIINKGIASKFNQKIRTMLIEQNDDSSIVFQPTPTPYDATSLVQAVSERVVQSPTDKVTKMLAGLTPEVRAAILAQFASAASSGSDSSDDVQQ